MMDSLRDSIESFNVLVNLFVRVKFDRVSLCDCKYAITNWNNGQ